MSFNKTGKRMKRILLVFTILALTACSNRIPAPVTPDGGDSSSSEVSGGGDSTDDGGEYYVLSSVEAVEEHYTLLENPVYVTEQKTGKAMLKSCSMRNGEGDPLTIAYTYNFPKSVSEGVDNEVITYALNADGYISSYSFGDGTAKLEYDSDGRLVKKLSESSVGTITTDYYYDSSFDLVKISRTYSDGSRSERCIEYTAIPSKSAPLQELHFETELLGDTDFFNFDNGLFGNYFIPRHLIKAARETFRNYEYNDSYSYKLDEAGNVIEMKCIHSSSSLPDKVLTTRYKWKKSSVPTYAGWLLTSPDSPYNSLK